MCLAEHADPGQLALATPRHAPGEAVDPIALAPVDSVSITTLVDNVYDGLLTDDAAQGNPGVVVDLPQPGQPG